MAGKRFRKIQQAIKLARKMNIDITGDDNIKAYLDYREGISKTYDVTGQTRGSSRPITLSPFCVPSFTARYVSKMSGRAFTAMSTLGLSEAELNIDTGQTPATDTTATNRGQRVTGFTHAAVVVTLLLAAPIEKQSGILLLAYKKRNGESYTFPFGKQDAVGQRSYTEMTGYLLAELGKGDRTVAFRPERPA